MLLQDYITRLAGQFAAAGIYCGHGTNNAYDEAVFLVFGSLGLDYLLAVAEQNRELAPAEAERLEQLARARIRQRIPTAYLLGKAWFAGYEFHCDRRALIPRSPIAELITGGFEPLLSGNPGRILDLCCGGGCIGIACALRFPSSEVVLADISAVALELARDNIRLHGLEERVVTRQSDLFAALAGDFDLIVANPPYVSREELERLPPEYRHEPALGLDGGADGIDIVARLLEQAANRLGPGGWLILETGYSADELQNRFSESSFLWLEFEHGGAGVCALNHSKLKKLAGK